MLLTTTNETTNFRRVWVYDCRSDAVRFSAEPNPTSAEVGLSREMTYAIEGPGWLLPDLEERLADARRRAVLLDALEALEAEPTLLGVSAHLLVVAQRV
jgi:hypothetical protein